MTTFLQYVGNRLLGRPSFGGGGGRSVWPCPKCLSGSAFGSLPHLQGQKDRFRCFACGWRGDEADLLQLLRPADKWPAREAALTRLRSEYDKKLAAGELDAVLPSPGRAKGDVLADSVADQLREEFPAYSAFLLRAANLCDEAGVCVEQVVESVRALDKQVRDTDRRELATCTDPDCPAVVCKLAAEHPTLDPHEVVTLAGELRAAEADRRADRRAGSVRSSDLIRRRMELTRLDNQRRRSAGLTPREVADRVRKQMAGLRSR